jgi:hypothetical protein
VNKTNDTEKTRELTEAELDAVSGGGAFVKWNFSDGWPTHLRVA